MQQQPMMMQGQPMHGQPMHGQPMHGQPMMMQQGQPMMMQQGQPMMVQQQPGMVVVSQVVVGNQFREVPVSTTCQFCQHQIVTSTQYVAGTLAWVACLGLAFVGCWLGCCLIPFCVDGAKDVIHTCPNCHQQVGVLRRM